MAAGKTWITVSRWEPDPCRTVGFVLRDDKHFLVLAGAVHGHEATGVFVIPTSAIRKRRRLR